MLWQFELPSDNSSFGKLADASSLFLVVAGRRSM
jgi:hypothetical protein